MLGPLRFPRSALRRFAAHGALDAAGAGAGAAPVHPGDPAAVGGPACGECWLTVRGVLRRDASWARAGFEVGVEQLRLDTHPELAHLAPPIPTPPSPPAADVDVDVDENWFDVADAAEEVFVRQWRGPKALVSAARSAAAARDAGGGGAAAAPLREPPLIELSVDKHTGLPRSLCHRGRELLHIDRRGEKADAANAAAAPSTSAASLSSGASSTATSKLKLVDSALFPVGDPENDIDGGSPPPDAAAPSLAVATALAPAVTPVERARADAVHAGWEVLRLLRRALPRG